MGFGEGVGSSWEEGLGEGRLGVERGRGDVLFVIIVALTLSALGFRGWFGFGGGFLTLELAGRSFDG